MLNAKLIEAFEDALHLSTGISKKCAPSDSNKPPPETLEDRLALKVLVEVLQRMKSIAIALDRNPARTALHHEIKAIRTDLNLWADSVGLLEQGA